MSMITVSQDHRLAELAELAALPAPNRVPVLDRLAMRVGLALLIASSRHAVAEPRLRSAVPLRIRPAIDLGRPFS